MNTIELENAVWKEDKYYVAQCLNVEVSSFGKTKKEALSNLEEALVLYFEDAKVSEVAHVKNAEIVSWSIAHA